MTATSHTLPLFAAMAMLGAGHALAQSATPSTGATTASLPGQIQATIYGRANIDYERIELGGTPAADAFAGNQRVSSNSSRLGVRASREFEGLKVFAQIECGVSWDAGGDTLASRDTFAGIEGAWGKVRLGKMDTPMKEFGGITDRFKGTGVQDDGSIAALGGSGNGFSRRQNNSLRLDSPDLAGLRLELQYGFENEDAGQSDQKKVLSLGADYNRGPLRAMLAWERHSNFNAAGRKDSAWRLGANYDFGFVNLGLGYTHLDYDLVAGTAKRKYAAASAAIPVGRGAISLRYGKAGGVGGSAPAGTTVAGADGAALYVGPDSGARQVTVGYEHNLFKGAQVYAYWTKISNDANANYRFGVNALNVAAADRGASPQALVVGMLYDF